MDGLNNPQLLLLMYVCMYVCRHSKITICVSCNQVNDAILEVDGVIGSYMSGLKARNIEDCVNLVILSDHGK